MSDISRAAGRAAVGANTLTCVQRAKPKLPLFAKCKLNERQLAGKAQETKNIMRVLLLKRQN